MARQAPGKTNCKGISIKKLMRMFPNEDTSRAWLETQIWPDCSCCPYCGSSNAQFGIRRKTLTHRCRHCPDRPQFNLKAGTVMKGTKRAYRDWTIAIHFLAMNLNGVSSMKSHNDLQITQKSAWHLMHRLRSALESSTVTALQGPVATDEIYVGGNRRALSNKRRRTLKNTGRGVVGKAAVAGDRDRETNEVTSSVFASTDKPTLQGFIMERVELGSRAHSGEAKPYTGMDDFNHEAVNNSVSMYVNSMAQSNCVEGFLALLKRGYHGSFHQLLAKHLHRFVNELVGLHIFRVASAEDMMVYVAKHMTGKRLQYRNLLA